MLQCILFGLYLVDYVTAQFNRELRASSRIGVFEQQDNTVTSSLKEAKERLNAVYEQSERALVEKHRLHVRKKT